MVDINDILTYFKTFECNFIVYGISITLNFISREGNIIRKSLLNNKIDVLDVHSSDDRSCFIQL